jgi:hypothetical protein
MVSVWATVAAWLIAWTILAWLSMNLLKKVRPGETVPMRRTGDGRPAWRVQPWVAALLTPALATLVGLVTIGLSFAYGRGLVPATNLGLPAVLVAAHWLQVSMAVKVLEQERDGR